MPKEKQHSEHIHTLSQPDGPSRAFILPYSRPRGICIILLLALLLLVYHRCADDSMGLANPNTTECNSKHPYTDAPRHATSIFLPYTKPFAAASVPRVKTTIEGVDHDMPLDTGSTGILVGAPLLPSLDPSDGVPAYHYLTSSRILYNGRLINLIVTFHGSGNSYAKASVPVFIVDKSWTCPSYDPNKDTFTCPPGPGGKQPTPRDTSQIMYMGVGFGRNRPGNGQPSAVPSANPFLNIVSMNGRDLPSRVGRAGWVISTEGVHVGLTEANTRGFNFTRLERGVMSATDPRDWAMARMRFSIAGMRNGLGYGLVDSGVAQMYIRAEDGFGVPTVKIPDPHGDRSDEYVERVKVGTPISIGFPSLGEKQVAGYTFVVGEQSPMAPSYVAIGKQTPAPYVNTGRSFLCGYSIAFDAVDGRFGFRPAGVSTAAQL
jgi:hypothetical protein